MKTFTRAAQAALSELHPDSDVQVAIWRVYLNAPGLLDGDTFRALERATQAAPTIVLDFCPQACLGVGVLHPIHDLGARK